MTTDPREGQQVSKEAVVNVLIHGALADQIAAANNITVTDGEREALLKDSSWSACSPSRPPEPIAYDVADQQIVAAKVGGEAYLKAVGSGRSHSTRGTGCSTRRRS